MTDLHKTWHDNTERVSQVYRPLENSISTIQDGGPPTPGRPILYHREISRRWLIIIIIIIIMNGFKVA